MDQSADDRGEPRVATGERGPEMSADEAALSLTHVMEIVARAVHAERVGLWMYGERGRVLERTHLFLQPSGVHYAGGILRSNTFPHYFEALESGEPLIVDDPRTDRRLRELVAPYIQPLGITAWLDHPVRVAGETVGWLRFERVGGVGHWSPDQQVSASARAAGSLVEELLTASARGPSGGREAPSQRGRLREITTGLERVVTEGGLATVWLDAGGVITVANDAFARTVGLETAGDVLGVSFRDFLGTEVDLDGILSRVARSGRLTGEELHLTTVGDDDVWALASASWIPEATGDGGQAGYLLVLQDITRRKAMERELMQQARRDPLTDLPNRRLLWERGAQALALAERHDRDAAILYVDLAGFKDINDTYGHAVGDAVLVSVARRLEASLRESDVAARIGGDEFAVLLAEVRNESGAREAVRRIHEAVARPVDTDAGSVDVRLRVGVALYPHHGLNLDELLEKADTAMYRARPAGPSIRIWDSDDAPPPEDAAQEELRRDVWVGEEMGGTGAGDGEPRESIGRPTHTALRRALDEDELLLHYQPIFALPAGGLAGAEALLRWHHSELGLLPAARFLGEAARAGLMAEVDRWALDAALSQASAWVGKPGAPRWVAVNFAGTSLQEPGLVAFIRERLEAHDLPPEALMVEVTEAGVQGDRGTAVEVLAALRDLGIRVALDRSGVGAATLAILHRLPADVVKVDLEFVLRTEFELTDPGFTVALRQLSGEVDAQLLAERIEDETTYAWIRESPFSLAQGFFPGRPVLPTALAR